STSRVPSKSDSLLMLDGSFVAATAARALSWVACQTPTSKIVSVQKVLAPMDMICIRTRSGAELRVTRDHKILVDTIRGPTLVAAEALKAGMELYSTMKFDVEGKEQSVLESFLVPEAKFYFHLRDDEIERKLSKFYGSLKTAGTRLSLNYVGMSEA